MLAAFQRSNAPPDGPTDAAGAYADGDTVTPGDGLRAARSALRENDAYGFFSGLRSRGEGGLVFTGPTGTNVMDLALVAIMPR